MFETSSTKTTFQLDFSLFCGCFRPVGRIEFGEGWDQTQKVNFLNFWPTLLLKVDLLARFGVVHRTPCTAPRLQVCQTFVCLLACFFVLKPLSAKIKQPKNICMQISRYATYSTLIFSQNTCTKKEKKHKALHKTRNTVQKLSIVTYCLMYFTYAFVKKCGTIIVSINTASQTHLSTITIRAGHK